MNGSLTFASGGVSVSVATTNALTLKKSSEDKQKTQLLVQEKNKPGTFLLDLPSADVAQIVFSQLKSDIGFNVDPNYMVRALAYDPLATAPNDISWTTLTDYNVYDINTTNNFVYAGYGDREIGVAVLDTGLDSSGSGNSASASHSDLDAVVMLPSESDVNRIIDLVNSDTDPEDDNGHGTHVAGIISAFSQEDKIRILPIKVLDANGLGNISNVIGALDYITTFNEDLDTEMVKTKFVLLT